jgi:hypothetical protein
MFAKYETTHTTMYDTNTTLDHVQELLGPENSQAAEDFVPGIFWAKKPKEVNCFTSQSFIEALAGESTCGR